jgi:hypothetical protein
VSCPHAQPGTPPEVRCHQLPFGCSTEDYVCGLVLTQAMALVISAQAAVPPKSEAAEMTLAPAAVDAKQLLEVGQKLGLDPIRDIDLTWIVQEYLNSPLPQVCHDMAS